ncbi:MAG: type II toxin-antitoxin system VapC family toxin, partial [Nitrososphaerales archaeon]
NRYVKGDQFFISSISHFQIVWGYSAADESASRYREFLKGFRIEVTPMTKSDAEVAAEMKPSESDILDALIASCVRRYDASLWTGDRDFFKFLPKSKVQIFS